MSKPKKIFIFGIQGAGKTTLAEKLGKHLEMPVYFMDRIFYDSNWKLRSLNLMTNDIKQITESDKWIFDGFHTKSSDEICLKADLCISITSGRFRSYYNIFRRRIRSITHGRTGPPEGSNNKVYFSLIKKVWARNRKSEKRRLNELQNNYSKLEFISIKRVNKKTIFELIEKLKAG